MDAWLTELSLILTMAAHSEEFASLAKNIKHVWFILTKIPPHTWGNGGLSKQPREAVYAALFLNVRRQRPTLKSRHENWGRVNMWGFFEFVKFLFAKTLPGLKFLKIDIQILLLHFVSRAKCRCKRGTWEGGRGPEHGKKNCNEYRINARKANKTPPPQQLLLDVRILTSTLDVIYNYATFYKINAPLPD